MDKCLQLFELGYLQPGWMASDMGSKKWERYFASEVGERSKTIGSKCRSPDGGYQRVGQGLVEGWAWLIPPRYWERHPVAVQALGLMGISSHIVDARSHLAGSSAAAR